MISLHLLRHKLLLFWNEGKLSRLHGKSFVISSHVTLLSTHYFLLYKVNCILCVDQSNYDFLREVHVCRPFPKEENHTLGMTSRWIIGKRWIFITASTYYGITPKTYMLTGIIIHGIVIHSVPLFCRLLYGVQILLLSLYCEWIWYSDARSYPTKISNIVAPESTGAIAFAMMLIALST